MNIEWTKFEGAELADLLSMMSAFAHDQGFAFDIERTGRNVRNLLSNPAFGEIWLVRAVPQVFGYLVVTLGFSFEFGGHDSFLDEIYIIPEKRGQGIGGRSLAFSQQVAYRLGATTMHLEASGRRDRAVRFYTHHGFLDRGYRLLSKPLQPSS